MASDSNDDKPIQARVAKPADAPNGAGVLEEQKIAAERQADESSGTRA
jgi:hypothetical protein